jgi:error-prone DNA polymerase
LAYASAYLKCHYLEAFTCALLNNQPMGFYHPAVLIKDAQRHGLRVLPVDVTRSEYLCTLEALQLRLGLNYVRGLRASTAKRIVEERARGEFASIDDLARRVPELQKDEMARLAEVGALNPLESQRHDAHRRDALWKATRAARTVGPLLEEVPETDAASPLARMTIHERLHADYQGTGVTVGRHPMAHHRKEMRAMGVTPASELPYVPPGGWVRVAGCVIVRQRPGTAKGILFISMEDETGITNIIVSKDLFAENRLVVLSNPWLLIEGPVQNVDNVIHVQAKRIRKLDFDPIATASHDFH